MQKDATAALEAVLAPNFAALLQTLLQRKPGHGDRAFVLPHSLANSCEPAGIRTLDQEIKSLLLYR